MMTFIDKCLAGECSPDDIDDYVELWHDGHCEQGVELHTHLGLDWDEYARWFYCHDEIIKIVEERARNV